MYILILSVVLSICFRLTLTGQSISNLGQSLLLSAISNQYLTIGNQYLAIGNQYLGTLTGIC